MAEDRLYMQGLDEYIRQGEPQEQERGRAWQTAIGLQEVDGLKTSPYLLETARRHIEGDITIKRMDDCRRAAWSRIRAALYQGPDQAPEQAGRGRHADPKDRAG